MNVIFLPIVALLET